MPSSITFLTPDDQGPLINRIEILETAERQRQDRHEHRMEPEQMVEAAYRFRETAWYRLVEKKFVQFENEGYYNADDEETHIFDELCNSYSKATALAFRAEYSPIKSVVTRLLMRDHPWARPLVEKGGRRVTKIRTCKADPLLWHKDPLGFKWLKDWHDKQAEAREKRTKAKEHADA